MIGQLGQHDFCSFEMVRTPRARTTDEARRIAVIFAAIIGIAVQIISGAVVIGADDALQPLITTSELIVGQNRFAFGLAKQGKLIEHADVLFGCSIWKEPKPISRPKPMRHFGRWQTRLRGKMFIVTPMVAAMFTTATRCGAFT